MVRMTSMMLIKMMIMMLMLMTTWMISQGRCRRKCAFSSEPGQIS